MVSPSLLGDRALLARLPHEGYHYVSSITPDDDPIELLSMWRWVGVLGPRTYIVGSRRADVERAPVFASTAPTAGHGHASATTLVCDTSHLAIPDSGTTTRISVLARRSDGLRIRVRQGLAPLPRVGAIYVRAADLACNGTASIGLTVGTA
jgi:hypothetical protein